MNLFKLVPVSLALLLVVGCATMGKDVEQPVKEKHEVKSDLDGSIFDKSYRKFEIALKMVDEMTMPITET